MEKGQTIAEALDAFAEDMDRLHGLGEEARTYAEKAKRNLAATRGEEILRTRVPLAVDYYASTVRQKFLQELGNRLREDRMKDSTS